MPHYNDLSQLPPVNIMDSVAPETPAEKSYIVAKSDLDKMVDIMSGEIIRAPKT